MIPITKPFLPPQEDYQYYLNKIWETNWLTNKGPLVANLEERLGHYLHTENPLFVSNGTMALQIAIKALGLTGEIITTPFSFVATTSSIVWENCRPVFVDIDKYTLNIDPKKIESAITENTSAIVATHVYGNPCEVEQIKEIADRYDLKIIYDAAHAFGVRLNGESVFNHGDISVCSLHATKLYHSGEGGLIFTQDESLRKKMAFMRNFGFDGPEAFAELGINGKNSEFHAAMGHANLDHIQKIHQKRQELTERYQKRLAPVPGFMPQWHREATFNYAYLPFVFDSEQELLTCVERLRENKIQPRRYFYPSLSKVLPYLPKTQMPISENIAPRVLCLPLYFDLSLREVDKICDLIE